MTATWVTQDYWVAELKKARRPKFVDRPMFNPRPRGVIRPGSAAEAILELLRRNAGQLYWRHQIIHITGRTRKAVDWGLIYLEALHLIEAVRGDSAPQAGNTRYRLMPERRKRGGRPRLPPGRVRVPVPMRIREELVPLLKDLGQGWLELAIEAAFEAAEAETT